MAQSDTLNFLSWCKHIL